MIPCSCMQVYLRYISGNELLGGTGQTNTKQNRKNKTKGKLQLAKAMTCEDWKKLQTIRMARTQGGEM